MPPTPRPQPHHPKRKEAAPQTAQKKEAHPERAKNAKNRAPASENTIRLFYKIRKYCAYHAKWTCLNSLVTADLNMHFFALKKRKKRVSPARGAKFERDKWQFWRRRDSGFAGIYIYIHKYMCVFLYLGVTCQLGPILRMSYTSRTLHGHHSSLIL